MTFFCIKCGKNLDENKFYRKVKNRCKGCSNEKFKCELCGKFLTKKQLTNHIEREHQQQQNESKSNAFEKPRVDNKNNQSLLVGPPFSGKTYLVLKVLSGIPHRGINIESPNQLPNTTQILNQN